VSCELSRCSNLGMLHLGHSYRFLPAEDNARSAPLDRGAITRYRMMDLRNQCCFRKFRMLPVDSFCNRSSQMVLVQISQYFLTSIQLLSSRFIHAFMMSLCMHCFEEVNSSFWRLWYREDLKFEYLHKRLHVALGMVPISRLIVPLTSNTLTVDNAGTSLSSNALPPYSLFDHYHKCPD
jgi:hypothetical protein